MFFSSCEGTGQDWISVDCRGLRNFLFYFLSFFRSVFAVAAVAVVVVVLELVGAYLSGFDSFHS